MKKLICILATGVAIFLSSVSVMAQQVDVWGDFLPGTDGLSIGSKVDNSYSALVINGPNEPFYEANKREIVFKFRTAGTSHIRALRGGSWGTFLQFLTTGEDKQEPVIRMHLDEYGRVGIGTTTPQNKLDVNGTIRAKEVRVESGWADFVFKKDYQLPTLEQVKQHINDKGHLPNIPSEAEVKANGVDLGSMNVKLLQKIEELTLYIIKQQECIELMQNEIGILKEKVVK